MNNQAEQLDQAINQLRQGQTADRLILAMAADEQKSLAPLLKLSQSLKTLPKLPAPTPLMQHRYAEVKLKSLWFAWIHVSKIAAASTAVMLLVSTLAVTGYAAYNSAPGQTLFAVKKSAEKLQLVLAYNQDQKASLQVEIAKKRLDEAQKIFSNPQSNLAQEKAALNELADQTRDAVAVVTTVTQNSPKSAANHPLLNSLDDINKQQQTLVNEIKPDNQIKTAASGALAALKETSDKLTEIKQAVSVASNEQTLAALKADPNSVAVLGQINVVEKNKLTVEKTVFILTSNTVIKNEEGKILSSADLNLKTKVNIFGIKKDEQIEAKEITISSPALTNTPEVKSASTTTATAENKTATNTQESLNGKKYPSDIAEPDAVNPAQAIGSFIYEDPRPQFVK